MQHSSRRDGGRETEREGDKKENERERERKREGEAEEERQRQSQSQRLPLLHLHFMASVFSDFVAVLARCLLRTPPPSLQPLPLPVSSPVLSRKLVCPSQHRTDDIASPKEVATFTILIRVVAVVLADLVDAVSQQEERRGYQ